MRINGKTKIVGILGYPVEHSLSPRMHNAAFKHLNLNYCYVPFLVKPEQLESAIRGLKALNIVGVNVTVPHKESVIAFLDNLSDEARLIGAVNTIKNEGGVLTGYNTDGLGFIRSLDEKNIQIFNKRVLVIGAGGAARAVGYYLCKEASTVYIYNRNIERAQALSNHLFHLKQNIFAVNDDFIKNDILSVDIIINATPLGLRPDDPPPMNVSFLNKSHIVCDLVYDDTPFLKGASTLGCKTLNGLGMLLWQGVFAFELWTGIQPPVSVMKRAITNRKS